MEKKHYEAVWFTGSTWGAYGKPVIDRHCGHKHKTEKAAEKCWEKEERENEGELYNGVYYGTEDDF